MDAAAKYMNLPFSAAIDFFRQKVNLTTKAWDDIWGEMHTRAFTVAGATNEALLEDLRAAVDKAISTGTTLADFRKDFDAIIETRGWSYKGTRGWRTAVIYDTNLSVAYSAGRYRQQSTPAVKAVRPYFRYMKSSSANRRPDHLQWVDLVLPQDDPFWDTHYPPNDWGCKCGVTSVSRKGLARLQEENPNIRTNAPADDMVEYVDKKTGQVIEVPRGIGPGWDYNPGRNPWPEGKS